MRSGFAHILKNYHLSKVNSYVGEAQSKYRSW